MLVDGDERVLVAAVRARELLEVDVQGAGLGARLASTGVRSGLDASDRAVEARGLDRGAEVLGAVLGRVDARLDLMDAAVIAPMHQRADLHPRELREVRGRADLVEAEGRECLEGRPRGRWLHAVRGGGNLGAGHGVDSGQWPSRVVGDEARLVREDERVDVAEARVDALLVPQLLDR